VVFADFVNNWTHGEDWQSWVAHSVIALFITLIASLIAWAGGASEPVIVGVGVAIGYYLIREIEQIFYNLVGHKPVKWFDGFMDVAVPSAVVLLVALIADLIRNAS
jgi:hypothetical protein